MATDCILAVANSAISSNLCVRGVKGFHCLRTSIYVLFRNEEIINLFFLCVDVDYLSTSIYQSQEAGFNYTKMRHLMSIYLNDLSVKDLEMAPHNMHVVLNYLA